MESTVEKREFGFLWKIIAVYLTIIVANVLIKNNVSCVNQALYISTGFMVVLGFLISILYAIKLKPVFNQLGVLIVCIAASFATIVFYVYDLPYKNILAFISLPLVMVLCGMWTYARFAKEEV